MNSIQPNRIPSSSIKYSFVIPTYNKKEPLLRTLKALNHQDGFGRDDYEAVVVDDGSPKPVWSDIKGINETYSLNYIYLHRCEDSCRSRTRNYGTRAAKGKYVIYLDDDIVVGKDYLKQLNKTYKYNEDLVVLGTRLNCPPHQIGRATVHDLRKKACTMADTDVMEIRHLLCNRLSYNLNSYKYPWMLTFTSNLAVPRSKMLYSGGFDENFKKWGFEDVELGYRLHKSGLKFAINSRLEAFHQDHPKSPTGEDNYPYFKNKWKEIFTDIEPDQLLSMYGAFFDSPGAETKFRKYQGRIRKRVVLELRDEAKLEHIKKKIRKLSKKKGVEVTVHDYCDTPDLGIWIQTLNMKNTAIYYYPKSLLIDKTNHIRVIEDLAKQGIPKEIR